VYEVDQAPVLFRHSEAGGCLVAGALVQDQFDVDSPWHFHDVHQLQYAFDGAMEVEDANHRALLPRQLAAWIPAGVTHRTSLHRVRSTSVMFSPSLLPHAGGRVKIICVPALLRELIAEAARWPVERPLDGKGQIFFGAFAMLLEGWIEHETPLSLPTSTDPRLNAAMEYTRGNLVNVSIDGAASAANMSTRTLRRRFRAAAGISWEGYRRRVRLLAAAELLDESSLSIGEIAARVGYENQGAFAKAFFHLLSVTPTEFRKRMVVSASQQRALSTVRSA
jgi:AraC-like DNA-binding protein